MPNSHFPPCIREVETSDVEFWFCAWLCVSSESVGHTSGRKPGRAHGSEA